MKNTFFVILGTRMKFMQTLRGRQFLTFLKPTIKIEVAKS